MTAVNENVSDLLESSLVSIKEVLRLPLDVEQSLLWNDNTLQTEMCVLVSFTGEFEGRLLIDRSLHVFGRRGENMYDRTWRIF